VGHCAAPAGMTDRAMRIPVRFGICAVLIKLCVSANLLTWMGLPYVRDGGAPPLKIHPGSFLLALSVILCSAVSAREHRRNWWSLKMNRLLLLFIAGMLSCLCVALALTGTGNLVVLLDTFLPAGLLAAVLSDISAQDRCWLRRLLQLALAANAALALCEAMAHATLIPFYLNDEAYHAALQEFRPTALYDHPLTGGVMTMIGLSLAPTRGCWRLPYIGMLSAALLAFGGRVAVAVTISLAAIHAAFDVAGSVLRRDPSAIRLLLSYGLVVLIGAALALAAYSAGLSDRLIQHLYWDPSAQVRLAQWRLLGELDEWQVFFGTRRDDLLALLNPLWLGFGVEVIENFWLLMFAGLGVIGFPIFVASLAGLLGWCWRRTDPGGKFLLLGVMAVASTSNSLGRKSPILVVLVAAILCRPKRVEPVRSHQNARVAEPVPCGLNTAQP